MDELGTLIQAQSSTELPKPPFGTRVHFRSKAFRLFFQARGRKASTLTKWFFPISIALLLPLFETGCATPAQTAALTAGLVAAGIATSGMTPSHELEQIYYLGVFDPDEQLPRSVYRLRVHGQSSPINRTRFASGWVPAKLIDALGSQLAISPEAQVAPNIQAAPAGQEVSLDVGRRMVVFGPEGTRTVPAGYRLVIVLGADPSKFFQQVDRALGATSIQASQQNNLTVQTKLFDELQALTSSREKLDALKLQESNEIPKPP